MLPMNVITYEMPLKQPFGINYENEACSVIFMTKLTGEK